MRYRYVHYDLEHGFINNWLAAGPQAIPVDLGDYQEENIREKIAQNHYDPASGITKTPVERGPLTKGIFRVGGYSGSWNYYACQEDHQVDHSGSVPNPHYLRSWAYTQLVSKEAQEVMLVLSTHGPADVWLNWEHVHRQEHFHELHPASLSFKVLLKKGINKILVRFEAAALGEYPNAMALQVCKPTDGQEADSKEPYPAQSGIHVSIPTLIEGLSRRNKIERANQVVYILQDVFEGGDPIWLHWPEDLEADSPAVVRLMTSAGRIYAEATVDGTAGDQVFLSFPYQIPADSYRILMMPLAWEYYDRDLRITHEIGLWSLGRSQYSTAPYGTYEERRQEALISAANFKGLYPEIAKMALDQWAAVESKAILDALPNIQPLGLIGVLGMAYRFNDHEEYPKEISQPVEEAILGFHYENLPPWGTKSGASEGDRFLSQACEVLAGQRYPEKIFQSSGKNGQWHRENGERSILEQLHQWGAYGFSEWDSHIAFAECLTALSHLVELAESESLVEMSAVLMDKLFTAMAINSFQGVFGSSHGRISAQFLKGGVLEPTSGIARLMWGTGIFNLHMEGPVSLACMDRYALPSIISDIALAKPEEVWGRERHAVTAERAVNKVTYKTPDAMLCSAQDYYPGENGRLEHIWGATLGPGATVFVNHPTCNSEADARQPNFWAGNTILPRVAQWKDVLIAVYHLPEDDWMGFTHAYFPTYAFDEYVLKEGWAFAQKDEGYLALKAARGFNLIQHGNYAYRELRSFGRKNIWLCHLGRAKLDGDFDKFQERILELPVVFEADSARFTSLRGEAFSFGWRDHFLRDGQVQPLSGFDHYETPFAASEFPSKQMEIGYGEHALRLNFDDIGGF
jgi:hypothetical protein